MENTDKQKQIGYFNYVHSACRVTIKNHKKDNSQNG